jgi:hypothetical protein
MIENMAIPQFTTKQLLMAMTWIAIGFGAIAYSLRPWGLSVRIEDDQLAAIEPYVRGAARVAGGLAVVAGLIPLITTRRTASVLGEFIAWTVPAWVLGTLLTAGPVYGNVDEEFAGPPWIATALAAIVYLAIIAYSANPKVRKKMRWD